MHLTGADFGLGVSFVSSHVDFNEPWLFLPAAAVVTHTFKNVIWSWNQDSVFFVCFFYPAMWKKSLIIWVLLMNTENNVSWLDKRNNCLADFFFTFVPEVNLPPTDNTFTWELRSTLTQNILLINPQNRWTVEGGNATFNWMYSAV